MLQAETKAQFRASWRNINPAAGSLKGSFEQLLRQRTEHSFERLDIGTGYSDNQVVEQFVGEVGEQSNNLRNSSMFIDSACTARIGEPPCCHRQYTTASNNDQNRKGREMLGARPLLFPVERNWFRNYQTG